MLTYLSRKSLCLMASCLMRKYPGVVTGTSLAVQWLKTSPSNAGVWVDPSSGSENPTCLSAKKPKHKKQKQYCNKFNIDFRKGPHRRKKKLEKKKIPWCECKI